MTRALFAVTCASLLACNPPGGSQPLGERADSSGVVIIANGGAATSTLEVTEDLRLGSASAAGPEQFASILTVRFAPDGKLVVGDSGHGVARVFTENGNFEREFGARGEGPGELLFLTGVVVSGDTIVLVDAVRTLKAVAFVGDEGHYTDWSLAPEQGRRIELVAGTERGWVLTSEALGPPPSLDPGQTTQLETWFHLMQDPGARNFGPSTLAVVRTVLYGVAGDRGGESDWALFPETRHFGYDRSGRAFVTDPRDYRVDIFDGDRLTRSVRRDYTPIAVEPGDLSEIVETAVSQVDAMPGIPSDARSQLKASLRDRVTAQAALPTPSSIPPLGRLLVSGDGSFWVERWDEREPSFAALHRTIGDSWSMLEEGSKWDIYDQLGDFVGEVALPPRFRATSVDGLNVVGVMADELDVEYVVRLRLKEVANE